MHHLPNILQFQKISESTLNPPQNFSFILHCALPVQEEDTIFFKEPLDQIFVLFFSWLLEVFMFRTILTHLSAGTCCGCN